MNARQILKQARAELVAGASGYTEDVVPVWMPYYWIGRIHAAKEILANDRVRRRNGKSKADRPTR